MTRIRDFTWPICSDCVHRVKRPILVAIEDNVEQRADAEEAYICEKGIDLDRNPYSCANKVSFRKM